jgi:hypothetical protein
VKIALFAVVLGLALVAAGCGGDDSEPSATPTAEWAEGFCSALVDWLGELERATGELRDYRSLSQEAFDQAGGDIRSATEDLTAELRGLGAPDTNSGEEARRAVDTFATSAEAELDEIEQAVEDVFGGTPITRAITTITASLTSINEAYTEMFASLRKVDPKKELQAALKDAESCDDL